MTLQNTHCSLFFVARPFFEWYFFASEIIVCHGIKLGGKISLYSAFRLENRFSKLWIYLENQNLKLQELVY
jgi:hypothetical protein